MDMYEEESEVAGEEELNKVGARGPGLERDDFDVGYTSAFAATASVETPTALDSPPPTLSARPKTSRRPPPDRLGLSAAGGWLLEGRPDAGMADPQTLKKEIDVLQRKIDKLSSRKLSSVSYTHLTLPTIYSV